MKQRFQKTNRVVRPSDFERAHASDYFAADDVLVIKGVPNCLSLSRLGLSVSRRVGNAVVRNRWKRLVREAFRLQLENLPTGWDFVIRPRKGARADAKAVSRSLATLSGRIDKYAKRVSRKVKGAGERPHNE